MIYDKTKIVGFDLETAGTGKCYGLQPFRAIAGDGWITMASFYRNGVARVAPRPTKEVLAALLTSIIKQDLTVIGWNIVFDASWLIAIGLEDLVFQVKWLDAMWLWKHAVLEPESELPRGKRKSYSLEAAVKEFRPASELAHKQHDDFEVTEEDPEAWAALLKRNEWDAIWPVELGELFWNMLNDRQQMNALVEAKCIADVARTRVAGILIDLEAAQELDRTLEEEYRTKFVSFANDYPEILTFNEPTKAQLKKDPNAAMINVASPDQLGRLLFGEQYWALTPLRYGEPHKVSGKVSPSTDKETLYELSIDYPQVQQIRDLRDAKNNRAKYATAVIASLKYNGDGRTRPEAKPFGTYTGRMTYGSNQQDKPKPKVKKEK